MSSTEAPSTRDRILRVAADLLATDGRDALSTRAVSAAAGVQAPTLYRLFGDKEGLLDAVASYGFESYLADKNAMGHTDDPVADLRRGWDLHVEFGVARPAFYELMYSRNRLSPAAREAEAILRHMVGRVAEAGRLAMSVERAARLVHSSGMGVVFTLNTTPPEQRDPQLSEVTREMVLRTITTDAAPSAPGGTPALASALVETLRAQPPESLSPAEHALLTEWLTRLADTAALRR
ncbi:TetR/AcrR family transcriptional regulator [Amycolatopsis sacchari]|uniref:TetR/AcrR family transcriptional regulator n=1 Tax=Amycolatopsis sacchari TaxID=115433 RepID=UPI003D71E041